MEILHRSKVLPEEIDSLGHMNVRYYMARMERANSSLIEGLGVDAGHTDEVALRRIDTYTRFRREQFEGATLHAVGGVLEVGEGGMRSYVEIRNPDKDEMAASFVVTTQLTDPSTRSPRPLQPRAKFSTVEIPDYAKPRTLDLAAVNTDVSLGQLDALVPEVEGGGMMSGKRSATIEESDADEEGWLRADVELMFLPFAKMAETTGDKHGPPVVNTADGRRIGWAVIETRTLLFGQPRMGDRVSYFSADVALASKSRHSRRWAMNSASGELLGMSDTIGLCIDLDARKAVDWPEDLRQQIQTHLLPELA